jgi:hypothetical protein
MADRRFTCPCCGYLSLSEWPGSYDVCKICFWEDDPVQLLDPWLEGGANKPSLRDSQIAYELNGAMELRFRKNVRKATPLDERDPGWRKVSEADRRQVRTPASLSDAEYKTLDTWYYWRRP